MAANPIRKVVSMLQNLQKKVEEEGKEADELAEKFQCYCKNNKGGLQEGIKVAEAKLGDLGPRIEGHTAKKASLEGNLAGHRTDKESAKNAMAQATATREKQLAEFEVAHSDGQQNIGAINKAVAALERGMGAGFLQTRHAGTLKRLVSRRPSMDESDRQAVLSFLSGAYAPQSGQITGLLKQLAAEMLADDNSLVSAEQDNVRGFQGLIAAKKKETQVLTGAIEKKLQRLSTVGVEIAEMKGDMGDTADGLAEDKQFLADLAANCGTKAAEHEQDQKMRAEEAVALAETIKILNDDDALDLFKKTVGPGKESFLQMPVSGDASRTEALSFIGNNHGPGVDFIAMALKGKQVGFDKVIKLIDDLVATHVREQTDDDAKLDYCGAQLDQGEDKHKVLGQKADDIEKAMATSQDSLAQVSEEIKSLQAGIKALDKSVVDATEQRKEESAEFKKLQMNNHAAIDLIEFAENRLNKFYNKRLYKAPAKRVLTEEERIFENQGGKLAPTEAPGGIAGTGISGAALVQLSSRRQAPAPETSAPYQQKTEGSNGVIAMMNILKKDLQAETTTAEKSEELSQAAYEKAMQDSAEKRAQDGKSLSDRELGRAGLRENLEASKEEHGATVKEQMATAKVIAGLHAECDFLVKYHETRKSARAAEVDSLGKAKSVLRGADYSLLQTGRRMAVSRHA